MPNHSFCVRHSSHGSWPKSSGYPEIANIPIKALLQSGIYLEKCLQITVNRVLAVICQNFCYHSSKLNFFWSYRQEQLTRDPGFLVLRCFFILAILCRWLWLINRQIGQCSRTKHIFPVTHWTQQWAKIITALFLALYSQVWWLRVLQVADLVVLISRHSFVAPIVSGEYSVTWPADESTCEHWAGDPGLVPVMT